jgi:hypothetical protein
VTVSVVSDQFGNYFFYILGNEAETEWTHRFNLGFVSEAHRLKCIDGFAGFIYWFDLFLETPRRYLGAEFPV